MISILSREDVLKNIKENEIKEIRNKIMLKLEEDFQNNKEVLANKFLKEFIDVCNNIVKLQNENVVGTVNFIIFTVLRTRIMDGNYKFVAKICNDLWWLDENHLDVGEFDANFVFKYYDVMKSDLDKARKNYVGKTVKQDVESLLSNEIINFLYYVARIAKYKILEATATQEFINIKKDKNIQIHIGEYFDFSEIIFNEYYLEKDLNLITQKIENRKRDELCFWDLKGISLKKLNLVDVDFRFTDMRFSNIKNSDMSYSLLAGTIFNESNLENVNFSFSILNEASFKNANCKGANFNSIIGYAGLEDKTYWDMVGYYPLNFNGASLENASFEGADIRGAVFENANLAGTTFSQDQLKYLNLSSEQIKVLKKA